MPERLERHPLSAIWGDMPEGEYAELVESVRREGILDYVIKTLDDQVLDGWHRYRAAHDAGVEHQLMLTSYLGQDPVSFVIRRNAHRRHLTAGQRTICVARCYGWAEMGSNQHHIEGVQTLHTLEEDKDEQEQGSRWANKSTDQLRDPSSVEAVGAERNPESVFPAGDDGRAADEVRAMGEAEEGLATERMANQGERLTSGQLAERADASKRTADDAKAIIRAGLDDAVMANEVPFSVAAAQARGESEAPKPPTKTERLEAERDALALDVQEKAGRIDEMEDELQFHRGNMNEQEHERHKAFTAVRAELSTALSQNNEWMTKANDEVQARKGMTYDRDRWRERAMHPCANCGTEAEWADG